MKCRDNFRTGIHKKRGHIKERTVHSLSNLGKRQPKRKAQSGRVQHEREQQFEQQKKQEVEWKQQQHKTVAEP